MKSFVRFLSFLFVLVIFGGSAIAEPLRPPVLKEGVHVYAIPEGFDPPLIGRSGMTEMEAVLKTLHYPFYVVLSQQASISTDEQMAEAVDDLTESWQRLYPNTFKVATSQVFILSYNPKKYRFLAGAKFKSELGFERDAHRPYTALFERYAKGTPKDPKTGILEMAKATDEYLFDQTDPGRIEARKEAVRLAEIQKRRDVAFSAINGQITKLTKLLSGDPGTLPPDADAYRGILEKARGVRDAGDVDGVIRFSGETLDPSVKVLETHVDNRLKELAELQRKRQVAFSAIDGGIEKLQSLLDGDPETLPWNVRMYRDLLEKARGVRDAGNTEDMVRFSNEKLSPSLKTLKSYVDVRSHELFVASLKRFFFHASYITVLLLLGIAIVARKLKLALLRDRFNELVSHWEEKIRLASSRYIKYLEDREWAFELKGASGRTKEEFDRVTREVDDIYVLIDAMRKRIEECVLRAKEGSFFNIKALSEAIGLLESVFEFDTGVVNERDLFAKETKQIKVDPAKIEHELSDRYVRIIDGWNTLKSAAKLQRVIAEETIPQSKLDALFAIADREGIPRRWLERHPLFGDDEADGAFYARLNALRLEDPFLYAEEVEKIRQLEEALSLMLERLVKAVNSARSARPETAPLIEGVVVDPNDDPMITYTDAQREEAKLTAYLKTKETVEEIEVQSKKVVERYRACIEQREIVQVAVMESVNAIRIAEGRRSSCVSVRTSAERDQRSAEAVHVNCDAVKFIRAGDQYANRAEKALSEAKRCSAEHRILNAQRSAEESASLFAQATGSFEKAIKHCVALESQKREYEEMLASMSDRRERAISKVRRYGGSTSRVSSYRSPDRITGPVDYMALCGMLSAQESEWDRAVHVARRAYEDEQARERAREAEERARQARKEAEERRRRSSYSSSSSDNSWGGGFSSSSGGRWGGGFSSSSGGDW